MKVSVIIPTYKPQAYLWECLDSLIKQSLPKDEFEVILVLNGCCEPWKGQIEAYIAERKMDLCIKFIQTDIPGVSNARNIGLDAAVGEYIAFLDDDDYISPSYLEELYVLSDKQTLALSYQLAFRDGKEGYFPYYITKEYEKYCNQGVMPFYKPRKMFNGPAYKLIPREYIGERRFDTSFKNGEDVLFMFLISDKFKYATFSSKKAIYYRRFRKGSAISKTGNRIKRMGNALRLINKHITIYINHPFNYHLSFFLSRIIGVLKTTL